MFLPEQHNSHCIYNKSLQNDSLIRIACKTVLKFLLNEALF